MIDRSIIENSIGYSLAKSEIPGLSKREGKVRDVYDLGDKIIFVATDRLSAFDRSIANVPFKGAVLNLASAYWFEKTKDIVNNHFLDAPDPNVTIGKKLTIFPVEFVVRGYLTGSTSTSAWTAYKKGEREYCGHLLPDGMKKNQRFNEPLLTPTTKSEVRDEKISAQEIVQVGLMSKDMWDKASDIALRLYQRGVEICRDRNLILVDTKYEMGYDEEGNIYLCDEIHTPDSSRFWFSDTYNENFLKGESPDNIDKEFLRLWYQKNSEPYKDTILPEAPKELIVELSTRYQQLYEMITGKIFDIQDSGIKVQERLITNLKNKNYLK